MLNFQFDNLGNLRWLLFDQEFTKFRIRISVYFFFRGQFIHLDDDRRYLFSVLFLFMVKLS